jgi:vacuolar iron transporter family protein
MTPRQAMIRYRAHRRRELDSAALYHILARIERQPQLAEVYRRLAAVEEQHAQFWGERLRTLGSRVPRPRLTWKGRLRCWIAKRLGPEMVLPMLVSIEETERHTYSAEPETQDMMLPAEERLHARLLHAIANTSGAGMDGRSPGWKDVTMPSMATPCVLRC